MPPPWNKALIKRLLTTTVPFIRRYLPALCVIKGVGPLDSHEANLESQDGNTVAFQLEATNKLDCQVHTNNC